MSWQQWARCRETDPALFFPEDGRQAEPARRICRRCPVTRECLDAAMSGDERHGVWGGTSPNQRTILRNQLAARRMAS
jgi:WhiB family redox-sensing transcriptional regulator